MTSIARTLALLALLAALAPCGLAAEESAPPPDETAYLDLLGTFLAGRHDEAIDAARAFRETHPKSPWVRKAKFLEAAALVERRRFEEAERLYDGEAHRLLGAERKEEIARLILEFADGLATIPDPDDPGAPKADFARAHNLYRKALELEIGRDLEDEIRFRSARAIRKAGNAAAAANELREYLARFDPDWTGPVGSPQRASGQKRLNPPPAGKHVLEAWLSLGEAQIAIARQHDARRNLEDLLSRFPDDGPTELAAGARWLVLRTHRLPQAPPGGELDAALRAARDFLTSHPQDPRAVIAAWWIAESLRARGRSDDAVDAYGRFSERENFRLPADEAGDAPVEGFGKGPRVLFDEWRKLAVHRIGEIRFAQRQYDLAIETWRGYVRDFPDGPHWSDAQRGIIEARLQIGLDAVAENREERAREVFAEFLRLHPLDERARRILFLLGQMDHARAEGQEEEKVDPADLAAAYGTAVDSWLRLVGKYPNTEESSFALYRAAVVQEEKLGRLVAALASYRRLTWGSWARQARARIALMTGKQMTLRTERTFRTDEPAKVRLSLRNIEKVEVRLYTLDLESYFRKTHGATGVQDLDTALIQPDRTWKVEIEGYAKYAPLEREIEIPFDEGRPGVCLVTVGEENLEATTLVLRSDLDLILKTSRREALVYAQDMRRDAAAPGVRLLLSDGEKVFATGVTGEDGVFRGRFGELNGLGRLRVFAAREGHVAAHALDLRGLTVAAGLSPRGYVYTDRPAYRPGQNVGIRGIVRDVKDGVYTAPVGQPYVITVTDARGRLIRRFETKLSDFGTFAVEVPLDADAPLGNYVVVARAARDGAPTYGGKFQVARFQLEKMRLEIDVPRPAYFRGETVELTVTAEYAWGEPVAGRPIRLELPDGRVLVETSDANGRVTAKVDTTGLVPGSVMRIAARIEGENVTAEARVPLARLGYALAVKASDEVVLAGAPFDVTVRARTPDGEPASREVTLLVLRRKTIPPHPVLSAVPWFPRPATPAAEVTVLERRATTDEKTGEATIRLSLEEGGVYVLRAAGEDRFGQGVTAEGAVTVSGDEDATKLRFFAEASRLRVGEKVTVRLHSRLEPRWALLTFDGETVLEHRVVRLEPGMNDVGIAVDHPHFPNFKITVAALDDRELRTAAKPFTVERELKLTVRPLAEAYEPGAPGKVEIIAVDHLGLPVRAEVSLSLVDDALYVLFPDGTPPILTFFQAGAVRQAEFRVVATNGFAYEGTTRAVDAAVVAELERLAAAKLETARFAELRRGVAFRGGGARAATRDDAPGKPAARPRSEQAEKAAGDRFADREEEAKDAKASRPEPRKELPDAGWWLPSIVTGEDGRAVVEMPMPETTTRWRLTARGATVETLVGEARATVITRKDFFVEMKAPASLMEGDIVRVLARVHDRTALEGDVALTLTVRDGDRTLAEKTAKAALRPGRETEALFEAFTVPAVEGLTFVVSARAGELADAVARDVGVRPWGLEIAAHTGGVARSDSAASLELPGNRRITSRWMTVTVGPSVERAVVAMALGEKPTRRLAPPRWGGHAGSDLLAAATALAYARKVAAPADDVTRLTERVRALVASVVVTQRDDGGWGWRIGRGQPDVSISATTFWAMAEARKMGFAVDAAAFQKAREFLGNRYRALDANDDERKALLVHALAEAGMADFAHANRLYRERNALGTTALAHTALAFLRLDRKEIARELLGVLDAKAKTQRANDRDLCHWSGASGKYRHVYGDDEIETTALTVLAMVEAWPDSRRIRPAVDFLLHRRGAFGFTPAKARGPAVAALAAYFAGGKYAETDTRIRVLVNGKLIRTVAARGGRPLETFAVPADVLGDGKVSVELRAEGRGEYAWAATLHGFTPDLKDPNSWRYPYVQNRRYLHAPLRYRDRSIGVESSSPVRHVEIGQLVRVRVNLRETSTHAYLVVEEPLPSGLVLVEGSLQSRAAHHEVRDGRLVLYFPPGHSTSDYSYDLVGYSTGVSRVLPTVIRDSQRPDRMRVGKATELRVLAPGEKSDDPYAINTAERFALAKLLFADGQYQDALEHLTALFDVERRSYERDVARMLLWIHTSEGYYDARRIVQAFEVLRERYPELRIPFDKILVVGRAYRDMGEHERAFHVFRATIDASFVRDSNVGAVLEDQGQQLGSIDYQEDLWREYPDTAEVTSAYFALSQAIYALAPRAKELASQARARARARGQPEPEEAPDKIDLMLEAVRLLRSFLQLYPKSPLADDAAFSLCNVFLDLKQHEATVRECQAFEAQFPSSDYLGGFRYMRALGHFWRHEHEPAVAAATVVAETKGKDRDFARYILGQIHHAEGNPADAIRWYRLVAGRYPDAKEAIDYFEEKRVSLPEVSIVKPGEAVEIPLSYRNVREAAIQVYRVDLMKLYLREKSLRNVTKVKLAGIRPEIEATVALGDGKDYVDKERKIPLELKDEAAYLVICRGDDLFASGLVLVTPLAIEVQTDPASGRLRANVLDKVKGGYAAEVHVKAIGSADGTFRSGETDLRGVFVADGLRGKPTVIARAGDSRYAFHRGTEWIGPPPAAQAGRGPARTKAPAQDLDFQQNLRKTQQGLYQKNQQEYDRLRRQKQAGVEVQQAR